MNAAISVISLSQLASTSLSPPAIIDVRRAAAFARDPWMIAGAVRRLPDLEAWQAVLEPWRTIVVYCVHGGDVSRDIAAALAQRGLDALISPAVSKHGVAKDIRSYRSRHRRAG